MTFTRVAKHYLASTSVPVVGSDHEVCTNCHHVSERTELFNQLDPLFSLAQDLHFMAPGTQR
jgi:hypothetical protein